MQKDLSSTTVTIYNHNNSGSINSTSAVSYTHLDVYKRQVLVPIYAFKNL